MSKLIKFDIATTCQDVEQLENIVGRNAKWHRKHFGLLNLNIYLACVPENALLDIYPIEMKAKGHTKPCLQKPHAKWKRPNTKRLCIEGVMSPRWWHRSFVTLLPFTRTSNNSSWTRHHRENPKPRRWGWGTPLHHRNQTDCVRRVRRAATH